MDTKLIGITDLRSRAKEVVEQLDGRTVTVLSRSRPVAVLVHPDRWERLIDRIDELEAQIEILTAEGDTIPWDIARKELDRTH